MIRDNTNVNPSAYGCIHKYSNDKITAMLITNNALRNDYDMWEANKQYQEGDLAISNGNWYVAVTGGMSGNLAIAGKPGDIVFGLFFLCKAL